MLDKAQLTDLFDRLGTPPAGRKLILDARIQAPVRQVKSDVGNVITILASQKMRRDIRTESRHIEFAAAVTPRSMLNPVAPIGITKSQLYDNANRETRILAERARHGRQRHSAQRQETARTIIETACRDIVADGKGLNLRELKGRVPNEVLGSFRGVIGLLQETKSKSGQS